MNLNFGISVKFSLRTHVRACSIQSLIVQKMEVQALSPETIQDTQSPQKDPILSEQIDSTFGTTCIGRAPFSPSLEAQTS